MHSVKQETTIIFSEARKPFSIVKGNKIMVLAQEVYCDYQTLKEVIGRSILQDPKEKFDFSEEFI